MYHLDTLVFNLQTSGVMTKPFMFHKVGVSGWMKHQTPLHMLPIFDDGDVMSLTMLEYVAPVLEWRMITNVAYFKGESFSPNQF